MSETASIAAGSVGCCSAATLTSPLASPAIHRRNPLFHVRRKIYEHPDLRLQLSGARTTRWKMEDGFENKVAYMTPERVFFSCNASFYCLRSSWKLYFVRYSTQKTNQRNYSFLFLDFISYLKTFIHSK